ncbi:terminase large subunit domain-containing protein [Microbacterium sp. ASV81]|uniref:Terminase family protein n=1 Tax=Microbacterium capsulatum TaxID=3041921 RepID=A0ABU0XF79_9MICO|nr:terminase family protein [Microbacterium sp. ASV81]MDQ4213773.1 terminase family protein [Microbacterium sp. ASV81]
MTKSELATLRDDVQMFATKVLGRPLWPHQLEFCTSRARYRMVCAGRQVGKSAALAVLALWEAARRRDVHVLFVSAGEVAARRLLADCADLASRSELLRGSVLDESKTRLQLSNGSWIMSVPASEKQIRGWSVDLLIVDEAAFITNELWSAAEPSVVARPGSRIVLTSTPFGTDHFFRRLWQLGMSAPGETYESWHWPSSVSPLISEQSLSDIRDHENPITFAREYLAEWADASGALLSPEEIQQSVLDYELVPPELVHWHGRARSVPDWWGRPIRFWEVPRTVAGLDWGSAVDANALAVVACLEDYGLGHLAPDGVTTGDHVFWVPWLEAHHKMQYGTFIERIVNVAKGYHLAGVVSETNGVGAYPTEELARQVDRVTVNGLLGGGQGDDVRTLVNSVWTDNRRKQAMFGRLKGMLQAGRLILPNHPELLKQLAALTMVETAAGNVQISVPESRGHDDLAMALGQALSGIGRTTRMPGEIYRLMPEDAKVVTMPSGTPVVMPPRMLDPVRGGLYGDVFWGGAAGVESPKW